MTCLATVLCLSLLTTACTAASLTFNTTKKGIQHQRFDGWYNSKSNPTLGAAFRPLAFNLPNHYEDQTYLPSGSNRPNARYISRELFQGKIGKMSTTNKTALFAYFGQFLTLEVSNTNEPGCPVEILNVKVPRCDEDFDDKCSGRHFIPYERVDYDRQSGVSPNNPRKQINQVTSFLDGSAIYGNNEVTANILRDWKTGKLDADDLWHKFPSFNTMRLGNWRFPVFHSHGYPDASKYWKFGNHHAHENPALITLSVLFFRWHNHLVDELKVHFEMNADELFYKARSWVIASLQNIVIYEWLPTFLNETVEPYQGYKPSVDPSLAAIYDAVVMNYYLTLMPSVIYRRDSSCNYRHPLRFCNTFWKGQDYLKEYETSFQEFLYGMTSQLAEADDMTIVDDFKGRNHGTLYYNLQDKVVQIIMKGRDYGLPDYNTARAALGMKKIESWQDINPELANSNPELIKKMESVHKSLDNIDIFTGALMETTANGPGELIRTLTKEQLLRLRDGDRFWFENIRNGLFTEEEIANIRNITMSSIIHHVAKIKKDSLQDNVFIRSLSRRCPPPLPVNESNLETCPDLHGFNFFSGSEISFIATWIGIALIPGIFLLLTYTLGWYKRCYTNKLKNQFTKSNHSVETLQDTTQNVYRVLEWIEHPESSTALEILFRESATIDMWENGKRIRTLCFQDMDDIDITLAVNRGCTFLLIKVPRSYDLILQFKTEQDRLRFAEETDSGIKRNGKKVTWHYTKQKELLSSAITRKKRKKLLEKFLKNVFSEAFHLDYDPNLDKKQMHHSKEMLDFEMSKAEFAEALAMKTDSEFVERMFSLADTGNKNYISFRDFFNIVALFTKGTATDKLKMLFRMYDVDSSETLDRSEILVMFKSLLDMGKCELTDDEIDALVNSFIKQTASEDKSYINFEEFCNIIAPQISKMCNLSINWKAPKECFPGKRNLDKSIQLAVPKQNLDKHELQRNFVSFTKYTPVKAKIISVKNFVENYRQHIFFLILLYTFTLGVFAERFYYYSVENEHVGLRRMMGYGLSVTRGAAASMSFNFSLLLLTMCRNLITFLRGTFLNMYIPFDSNVAFHKLVAWNALFFTALHVIGYGFNFYHVATQPSALLCIFRNIVFRSDYLPKFHFWVFGNITGITGVLLIILVCVVYMFATQQSRRYIFSAFWLTHKLIIPLYIITILHGSAVVVQRPMFWVYFIGPAILFSIDKLVSLSRKRTEISVIRAEKLPSDVTYIEFKRPQDFDYKSGQWVKIACASISAGEFHPFTLTSAPYEDTLSVHIRALGPWTWKMRGIFDPVNLKEEPYPKLYLDGPYGAGQQDWYRFDISVLVGAGIGVTPYASILKDFVKMSAIKNTYKMRCQKLYFIWVTGSHRHFEWLIDILQEVERVDTKGLVEIEIFITKFFQNYDLRTAMMFICEEYFQKLSMGRSVFTGLKAKTHFGRPQLVEMLQHIHKCNSQVRNVGVFSCGPHGITKSVERACNEAGKTTKALFKHHYENF
ncbi:dual oxidase isoform X1 [Octopus bimaculoides]|uniref:NAD(P)H oxidase (H2O2-forming) n=1 Tax=Octopus bimaculoides TaxID=37653 RepID=A0A0L8I7Z5_OCTBM|nr:dual oxidase isoform X1 [Octopus bimaculoides]|eukprot:XP_014788035.1 PREDICTED: dual oxidase-like isoform X1 [Octopus bimaculoides]